MKIAFVFDKFLYGGIERLGIIYSSFLCDAGHTVHVYILDSEYEDIIKEFDSRCKIIIQSINPKFCCENHWGLITACDKNGIEIIQFALRFTLLRLFEPILLKKWKLHKEYYDISIAFSGHIKDLTIVGKNYIRSNKKLAWLHGTEYSYNMISPAFFRLYRLIKNLVCLSEIGDKDCASFNAQYNIKKVKIHNPCIIKNKVNFSTINTLKEKYGDFCLMVGRLADDKDQELLIRAFNVLINDMNFHKKLLLLGDGPKASYLKKLVSCLNLEDHIFFLGSHHDIENYYAAAKIYTHSSPLEGLPMVFLEAMHFGLPIISTDALPGSREVLGENGEFGIIVSSNAYDLALAIKSLYTNDQLYNHMSAQSLKRIKAFDANTIKSQLLNYLEDLNCE